MMNRKEEISKLLKLSEEDVISFAGNNLSIFEDCDEIHKQLAEDMTEFIKQQNIKNEPSRFIVPVGPVGQYPIFLGIVEKEKISLKNCYFFYMDENADNTGHALPADHPLSFEGEMRELWLNKIDPELSIPENQLFFPNEKNIHMLAGKIKEVGGIDICFGGIGIHGHIAFNEPEPEVENSDPRMVYLNDFTTTINAIRANVGGNLEGFPKRAFTLGMKQILNSRQIRLACRNGISLDWANTVLRLVLMGTPGFDYPCTFINQHKDFKIYTDKDTLRQPKILL